MAASLFEKTQEVMPPAQRVRTTRTESTRRRDDGGQDGEPRRLNEVGEGPVSQLGWRGQQLAKRIQQLAKQRPRHGDQGESRQGRLIHVAGAVELVAGAVNDAAKRADRVGQRISRVAGGVQNISETTDQAVKRM